MSIGLGKIIVEDPLSAVILHRLTGFDVEQTGWRYPGKVSFDRIPNTIDEYDHVLVAYGNTGGGMYVHISYISPPLNSSAFFSESKIPFM